MDYEKINLFPTRQRVVLNDKATKILFYLTAEKFSQLINGDSRNIVEKNNKKKGKIRSCYRLETSDDYIAFEKLGEYARDVFDCVISEYEEGNRIISLAMIQRALSGKAGNDNHSAYTTDPDNENKKVDRITIAEIRKALIKMMCTIYNADILDAYKELNYEGAEQVTKAPILPGKIKKVKLNGKITEVFVMTDESPLYKIAKIKNQILTYDATPLDVPNQNNTVTVTKLKNYTYRRIVESKQHYKNMNSTLTLNDIFTKCEIGESKRARQQARDSLELFFAHLQNLGKIKSYEWIKKGNKIYSVKFTF